LESFLFGIFLDLVLLVVELLAQTGAQFETAVRTDLLEGLQEQELFGIGGVFVVDWGGLGEFVG
jgi:hypothetical protein